MSNIEKIQDFGLLSELAYLTLESEYFQNEILMGGKYTNDKLIKYLNSSTEQIKDIYPDYFKDIFGREDEDKTADKYRDIEPHRVEAIKSLLDKYEIVKFASDDKSLESDFQGMLLKDKVSGEYIVSFRGTAGLTDAFVDIASGTLNINAQYNEAKSFVESILSEFPRSQAPAWECI